MKESKRLVWSQDCVSLSLLLTPLSTVLVFFATKLPTKQDTDRHAAAGYCRDALAFQPDNLWLLHLQVDTVCTFMQVQTLRFILEGLD